MEKLTDQQITDISKTITISILGTLQTVGAGMIKKDILETREAIEKDLKSGSIEKSVKQFNEIFK